LPDVGAVVLGLPDVGPAAHAVRSLEPILDTALHLPFVEHAGKLRRLPGALVDLAPADAQPQLGFPKEEPRQDLPGELLVDERVDVLQPALVLPAQRHEIYLGPGFHRDAFRPLALAEVIEDPRTRGAAFLRAFLEVVREVAVFLDGPFLLLVRLMDAPLGGADDRLPGLVQLVALVLH